jgi:hypothetical protein
MPAEFCARADLARAAKLVDLQDFSGMNEKQVEMAAMLRMELSIQ